MLVWGSQIFVRTTFKNATDVYEFLQDMKSAPLPALWRIAYSTILFGFAPAETSVRVASDVIVDQAYQEAHQFTESLQKFQDSYQKINDLFEKGLSRRKLDVEYALASIPEDRNEIDVAMKKIRDEGRKVIHLLYRGMSQNTVAESKLEGLRRKVGESDIEFRINQQAQIKSWYRRLQEMTDTIQNTTDAVVKMEDESSQFCSLIHDKSQKYRKIYLESIKKKQETVGSKLIRYAKKLATAFCVGATTGGAIGATFGSKIGFGNPAITGVSTGIGAMSTGTVAAILQAIRESLGDKYNEDIAKESLEALVSYAILESANQALKLYLGEIKKVISNVDVEVHEIVNDLGNLESQDGHERSVELMRRTYAKINEHYMNVFKNANTDAAISPEKVTAAYLIQNSIPSSKDPDSLQSASSRVHEHIQHEHLAKPLVGIDADSSIDSHKKGENQ
jgi:hypothetical protein